MIKSKVIYGCESRGNGDSPYLTRWTLLETRWGNLNLHKFHRSDADEMHDHPWPFVSLVLWPGYHEVSQPAPDVISVKERSPFTLAFRPAAWQHRVQLFRKECRDCFGTGYDYPAATAPDAVPLCQKCEGCGVIESPCYTVIWTGQRVREWGFFTKSGWQNWREYFKQRGC